MESCPVAADAPLCPCSARVLLLQEHGDAARHGDSTWKEDGALQPSSGAVRALLTATYTVRPDRRSLPAAARPAQPRRGARPHRTAALEHRAVPQRAEQYQRRRLTRRRKRRPARQAAPSAQAELREAPRGDAVGSAHARRGPGRALATAVLRRAALPGAVPFPPPMAAALGPAPPPPARAMERPPGPELGAAGDGPERPRGRRRGGPLPGEPSRSLAWQPGGPDEPESGGGPAERPGLGLLPAELHGRLLDQEDYRSRTRAVEELQRVLGALSPAAVASAPAPALLGLLGLLCALLDDANFAVVLGALEAAQLLALRLGGRLGAFLGPLVAAVAKGLGDPRAALRQRCHRLLRRLMEAAGPRRVLGLLLRREHLRHRNARVREEVVVACIAALLTYPGRELDLGRLAFGLAPALLDGKRRVRHAALEAFALLASAMGPGKSGLLFEAVDAVELEDDGDGVMHAVQARLARKSLPRLGEHGLVEYAVPLPSCAQGCGVPRGADTDWLLAGSRTQSAHSCGSHPGDAARSSGSPGMTARRVLSAGKGKNKLPWEGDRGGDGEGGAGDVFSSPGDFLHSPKLQPSQGTPGSDELLFSRRRPSRNSFQNSVDFSSERSSLCAGAVGSHQPHISGKCGALGSTQTRGKSGSVDSALQLLGLNNCQQDKVCASLNFSSKTQRGVCSQAEHTSSSQGTAANQGAFILPSYPLASPGSSPKHLSSPAESPKKSQDNTMSFSNSWPLKSFEGLHKPSSQKPRDSAGRRQNLQEKHSPLQLKPTLVRHPASRRGLPGSSRPVPPIPRLASPLPSRAQGRAEQCEDAWLNEAGRKLAADLSELSVDDEDVDQEEMQSSLRSLRNSAAKKRAKLSSNFSELDSPDSALKLSLSADSPSHASSPSSCSESGAHSHESLTSPVSTVPQRRRVKVTMSKSAQDKMRQKKRERKEQSHKEHQEVKDLEEKEKSPWERLNLNEPESTTADRRYKDRTPSVTHSPEVMDPSELEPFAKPEAALTEALALLADDDWEKKIEGLNFIRCLSAYHTAVLTGKLHETSLAVAQEVKNLRSGVSRAAVVCLGDLFTYLRKSMDQELDNTVKVLLHKAGESNTFIREEVDKALKAMVNNVTPARALCSLINGGQSHLHTAVRRCTAQHMADIVERMGPEWVLSGTKGVTDRTFPAIARFALDSSQQTRYYGRKMLFCMMTHPDFDKTLEKYVPAKDLPYIKEFVNNLHQKGLGEMPLDTPSAKGRRSHTGSVGHSRSSSTSRDALNITEREATEAREVGRKPVPRNSLESEEYVKDIVGLLNAKDFRDRINGIKQLLSDAENNQDFVVVNIVKIFDAFKSRLHDSNSKVNQVALETMHKMIPLLKDNLSPVINMLVPAMVDNNLNSKNPGIYAAATDVIQALCQHLDSYLLLQPFCTKVQFLNGKAKQDITEKLADLVVELYPRKPHAVEQKVLVVLWHLLGTMTSSGSLPGAGGNIRAATAKLSKALFAQMGPSLLAHAAAQPPHIKRSLEEFLEIAT
uniref:TOG array regulator of axonemal microtubules 1 n=1 Tax=Gallus gallus TaxID=9031 RepID=A0A8V0Z5M5_CHICK